MRQISNAIAHMKFGTEESSLGIQPLKLFPATFLFEKCVSNSFMTKHDLLFIEFSETHRVDSRKLVRVLSEPVN